MNPRLSIKSLILRPLNSRVWLLNGVWFALIFGGLFGISSNSFAAKVLPETEAFVTTQLSNLPKAQYVWIIGDLKKQTIQLLDHAYFKLRVPFWQIATTPDESLGKISSSVKTVWVLEEIGKEKPITVGIVIINQQIESLRILKFRESRGWEVELPSFTRQFDGIAFKTPNDPNSTDLNGYIDGISGATLSVRAVTKLSKLALLLQQHIDAKQTIQVK
jgi:hypothetical protein